MAYEQVEGPLPPVRDDIHSARIMAAIYENNRDPKGKKKTPYKPADFMPKWDKPPQSAEDQKNIFRRLKQFWQR